MKKLIVSFLIGCFLLTGCQTPTENEQEPVVQGCDDEPICAVEEAADMSAYEGFMEEDNQFISLEMKDFIEAMDKKESGIFYFGFATCPWCIEAVPVMNEAAKEKNVHIYYIDKRAQTSSEELIQTIEERFADRLAKNKDGKPTLYVPYVVVLKDGEVIAEHSDTVPGHDAHERKMNEEEKAQLKEIYLEMFEKK